MLNSAGQWRRLDGLMAVAVGGLALLAAMGPAWGADWPRFRGVNGSGVSRDLGTIPTEWSETENLKWSAELPGPGKSSPIVVGDRVIVTAWSGENPPDDLRRHLLCFDRKTGKELWHKTIEPLTPDEPFRGMFTENGYASHTPVSDGERIYAFFGLDGVRAYDMEGNELWRTTVGAGTDPSGWGTASSPILTDKLVIVPATSEDASLVGLDKKTGKEVWRREAALLEGVWGTPLLVDGADGAEELVIATPAEVWGLAPDTGKIRWYAVGPESRSMSSSAVADKGVVYMVGGRDSGTMAVRSGGQGDVTESHVAWNNNYRGGIGTPICFDGLLYSINNGVATCFDAGTGERIYQERLKPPAEQAATPQTTETPAAEAATGQVAAEQRPAPVAAPGEAPAAKPAFEGFGRPGDFADPREFGGFGGGFGGGGGGRGGMRQQDYSSPIAADGKIFFVRRGGETYVLAPGREFKQLAVNKFASDDGDFSATPASSDGELFIRSSNKLYCVGK
ncbi:MAG: PQQ-binding-like beta-propeller repeat protein [Planctomycetaceae bacterium]|nr:PQQ-binding-like beta-propeller repeat protein [Planctomycetaceae bacterium]